jgi:ATP-dependent helicase IRC3
VGLARLPERLSVSGEQQTTISPRPYQVEALAAIEQAAIRGCRRQLVTMPTGVGKTIVFSHLLKRRGGRSLVVVHRDELARQAEDKIRLVIPGAAIGIVKAERNELDAPITIASVQTVARPTRLAQVGRFDTVIVDEAHHAAADSYINILTALGAFEPDGPLVVGVTATPDRGDGQGLDAVFQDIVFERDLLSMIEENYLSDLRAVQVRLAADFRTLHTRAGDFIEAEVEELLLNADAPGQAVRAYRDHAAGRKALVFTSGVRLAHVMADTFSDAGLSAAAIDGGMPLAERRDILQRFACGDLRIVVNCMVLTEGFDEPSIDAIVIARPTRSRALYTQMVGRGTRTYPGKSDCLIVDLVGVTTRLDLITAATLFGIDADAFAHDTLCTITSRRRQEDLAASAQARLVAQTVDLFRQRRLHWVHGPGESFILSCGAEQVVLRPEGQAWMVLVQRRHETEILARGLPLDYAQGTGEDHVRRAGAQRLADPHAPWRTRPASDRQREALRRFRVPVRSGLTAGEAADALTQAIARAREARS